MLDLKNEGRPLTHMPQVVDLGTKTRNNGHNLPRFQNLGSSKNHDVKGVSPLSSDSKGPGADFDFQSVPKFSWNILRRPKPGVAVICISKAK